MSCPISRNRALAVRSIRCRALADQITNNSRIAGKHELEMHVDAAAILRSAVPMATRVALGDRHASGRLSIF
jgi:hypothetical protein